MLNNRPPFKHTLLLSLEDAITRELNKRTKQNMRNRNARSVSDKKNMTLKVNKYIERTANLLLYLGREYAGEMLMLSHDGFASLEHRDDHRCTGGSTGAR